MTESQIETITVLGNCQGDTLAACLRRMLPGVPVDYVRYHDDVDVASMLSAEKRRLVLAQNPIMSFASDVESARGTHQVIDFPAIVHAGFHPDLIRPKTASRLVKGPLGSNHSAIAIYGFLRGLDERQTEALFCNDVFQLLGYYDAMAESNAHLCRQFARFDLAGSAELDDLLAGGCFMHNTLHPKLGVIAMMARLLLGKAGITPQVHYPENLMADELANNVIWPIYPEIAKHFKVTGGEYVFQFKPSPRHTYDLRSFIAASYEAYAVAGIDASCHPRLQSEEMDRLDLWRTADRQNVQTQNPYRAFPDYQFWRRSVASVGHDGIDPVVKPGFQLDRDTRIGTAGSCFAQHIARRLAASGHNYLVTEAGEGLDPTERVQRNFGVYSARYGNIYTPRQLVQLFERAHGTFEPRDTAWQRADGRYVDPFRPEIEPDGFDSIAAVAAAREEHFAAVRTLFRDVDVLVFTLGLTEAWQAVDDEAVFPLCPMVVSGSLAPDRYAPINFSHDQIVDDLSRFLSLLRTVQPSVKVLLTVSPVPLVATFENRHVLVSTTASKAILRSAADAVCRSDPSTSYFPSYEIVSNPFFAASYFDPEDCRSVLPHGVDHVMRVFLKHYSRLELERATSARAAELDEEQKVVCEEERLDR
ncbi:GSCFA domain-containing protein [Novosphingobium olei]|uniref:GSCFA domain-containing protein n=1 Tax=Novosphingobium olei TaxID=2728851 RepID=UPI00309036A1|nr:GSCFA domain-containing protein [Novosphingobium olei]